MTASLGGVFFDQKARRSGTWKAIVRYDAVVVEYVALDSSLDPADRAGAEKAAKALIRKINVARKRVAA